MTPWENGCFAGDPLLPFGRMYEDPAIELEAFAPHCRVFCIASAGCTARALAAAGHDVVAVDIHPRQLAYARYRAAGGAPRPGRADGLISRVRGWLGLIGWPQRRRRAFLELADPAEQVAFWDRYLDTRRWRMAVDALLAPVLLRLFYSGPFVDWLPPGFGGLIRSRLRRCWATHPNRGNPYVCSLLLHDQRCEPGPPARAIQFVCADAAGYLESCPPAGFDGFSLSNIGDGVSPAYLRRLRAAVRHAAAPKAIVVSRSFAEPLFPTPTNHAARDRCPLWGTVDVRRAGEFAIMLHLLRRHPVRRQCLVPPMPGRDLCLPGGNTAALVAARAGARHLPRIRLSRHRPR